MPEDQNLEQDEVKVDPVAIPATEEPAEGDLPAEASERTRLEFEKLKAHNKELAEKLKTYEADKPKLSVLDALRPQQTTPVQEKAPELESLVDENGYVDTALLEKRDRENTARALKAEQEAREARERVEKLEQTQQVRETHNAFPWLDPDSPKYDQRFYNLVRNEMIGQYVEGRSNFYEAAKKVKEELYDPQTSESPNTEQVKREAIENFKRETAKEQLQTTGSAKASVDNQELVAGTRKGDADSIFKRLQASGY